MSAASFLRVQKLNGAGIIRTAGRHNLREIQAELGASGSIDATRTHMNQTLAGPATADDVAQLAKDLMQAAGATSVRKNDRHPGWNWWRACRRITNWMTWRTSPTA